MVRWSRPPVMSILPSFHPILACTVLGASIALGQPASEPAKPAGGVPVLPANTSLRPLRLAAGRPLGKPTALAIDDRGGILVAAHAADAAPADSIGEWLPDDLASTQPAHREALMKKWRDAFLPADAATTGPWFRRLADPDGDGVFELADLIPAPLKPAPESAAAALFSQDGITYLAGTPAWWLIPANPAGKAAPPKPLLTGMGIRLATRTHGLRGLTLGPDGRLYGTIGDQGFQVTTETGLVRALPDQGCAFRIEADGTGFEILHRGLRQPCGVAFDAAGNPMTIDIGFGPDEPARLIYLVDDGDSGWRMEYQAMRDGYRALGLSAAAPQAWTSERLWELAERSGAAYVTPPVAHLSGSPSSIISHPGTGFLESEAGRFLVCDPQADPAKAGILSLAITPAGAGMKLADSRPLVTGLGASDARFSWTGALVIADAGANRIVSLEPTPQPWRAEAVAEAATIVRENLDSWDSQKLAGLLKHPDLRLRLRAQVALTRKPDALAVFKTALASGEPTVRLHAIWGIGILARCGRGVPLAADEEFKALPDQRLQTSAGELLVPLLSHPDPETRAQATKAIGEALNRFVVPPDPSKPRNTPQPETFMQAEGLPLAALLADPSPRVRYFAALAIGKLKASGFYSPICNFLAANGNQDPFLRHAGAFALQHMATNPLMLTGLDRHPSPAVRLAAAIALRRMATPGAAAFINDPDPVVADESIRAVTDLDLPENRLVVGFLLDQPAARPWSPFMLRRLVHNAYRMGTAENATRLLKLVGQPAVPEEIQLEVLRLCRQWAEPPAVNALTGRWSPLPKRDPAEIKPVLAAEMPRLLAAPPPIRAAVEQLAASYPPTPPPPPQPAPTDAPPPPRKRAAPQPAAPK